jgi:hypothetical protein
VGYICKNDDLPQCLKTYHCRGVRVGPPGIGKCRKVFEKWYNFAREILKANS